MYHQMLGANVNDLWIYGSRSLSIAFPMTDWYDLAYCLEIDGSQFTYESASVKSIAIQPIYPTASPAAATDSISFMVSFHGTKLRPNLIPRSDVSAQPQPRQSRDTRSHRGTPMIAITERYSHETLSGSLNVSIIVASSC